MHSTSRGVALAVALAVGLAWMTSDVVHGGAGCITGYDPPALNVPAAGTSGAPAVVRVLTATASCQWAYSGPVIPAWIGFIFPAAAPGAFPITFGNIAPNMELSSRSAVLTFDDRPLTITQAGNPCPLVVSSTDVSIPANGGTGSFTVNTIGTACPYSVNPSDGVTIVSGGSGNSYPATVTFSVGPNTTPLPIARSVQVAIVGQSVFAPVVAITQNGPPIATDAPSKGYTFAVRRGGSGGPFTTASEPMRVTNSENPTASWTATTNEPWLEVSPVSGTSPASTRISIDPAAAAILSPGTYAGVVTLTSSIAPGTPSAVDVVLTITDASSITGAPKGFLDIPLQNATGLSGAVPVGGWALDDVGIKRVQIYRTAAPLESPGEVYLGDATRVRGARPDVANLSALPEATRGGWGFMLLSNVLPAGTNGTFTLSAYAEDIEGQRTRIGQATVTFDNAHSVFPFGTIDVPTQGGSASGVAALIAGWVLAQPGKSIPFDGSTIRLIIDGALQPNLATYALPRPDVASYFLFPSYVNAKGPGAHFTLDTTLFADGLHTVAWLAIDDLGVAQGIGSRFFTIANGAASQVAAPLAGEARSAAAVRALPQSPAFVWHRQGFDDRRWSLQWTGARPTEIRQAPGERLEVALDTWWWSSGCGPYAGYLLTGQVAGPLPPGASMDGVTGVFSWLPPVEFAGTFEFVFVRSACTGREERVPVRVSIQPR